MFFFLREKIFILTYRLYSIVKLIQFLYIYLSHEWHLQEEIKNKDLII